MPRFNVETSSLSKFIYGATMVHDFISVKWIYSLVQGETVLPLTDQHEEGLTLDPGQARSSALNCTLAWPGENGIELARHHPAAGRGRRGTTLQSAARCASLPGCGGENRPHALVCGHLAGEVAGVAGDQRRGLERRGPRSLDRLGSALPLRSRVVRLTRRAGGAHAAPCRGSPDAGCGAARGDPRARERFPAAVARPADDAARAQAQAHGAPAPRGRHAD